MFMETRANLSVDEPKLIELFTELTGESEITGRAVVMYIDMLERDYFPAKRESLPSSAAPQSPGRQGTV
jgi:hypothetical protein